MRFLLAAAVLLYLVRFVSRRAAVLALLALVTMPAALPPGDSASFAAVVPRLARAMAPWAVLLPFALVRGRDVFLRVALGLALAVETLRPGTLPPGAPAALVAGVVGAWLDQIAGKRPDPLVGLGVLVVAALVVHDAGGLRAVLSQGTAALRSFTSAGRVG